MGRFAVAAFAADVACLVLFALVGRRSHAEALDAAGLLTTLWPFLVGLVLAWLSGRLRRAPTRFLPAGVVAWATTLVAGMLLRALTGQGVQVAFVVVAAVVLGVLLLGWRAVVGLLGRRRSQAAR